MRIDAHFSPLAIRVHRIERPVEELFLRKHPGPAESKIWTASAARIDLTAEMIDARVDQQIDQQLEGCRDGHRPICFTLAKSLAAAAFDHVAGQREGSAGRSRSAPSPSAAPPASGGSPRRPAPACSCRRGQRQLRPNCEGSVSASSFGPSPFLEPDLLAETHRGTTRMSEKMIAASKPDTGEWAAASPRRPCRASSRIRGTTASWTARRDTPAGSARPAASARSVAFQDVSFRPKRLGAEFSAAQIFVPHASFYSIHIR